MYECFHCGHRSVIWQADFDLEDFGYEGNGLVHTLVCTHCGAEIEYILREEEEDESNSERTGDGQ